MDARWRIELLGGLRAQCGDRVLTRFRTQKTGALLAYLSYYHHRSHLREVLIEILWPECEVHAGRNNLSRELSWLRDQLEEPGDSRGTILVADRTAVRLNPDAVTTDVAEFDAALHSAARAETSTEQAAFLTQAVELYRGELLAGYYDDWILSEREWLAARFFQALPQLIAHLEEIGELDRALEAARRGVSIDPLREEAHGDLIRLYAAVGQPTAALRQYRELERLLKEQLDATPSAAIRQMAEAIEATTSRGDDLSPTLRRAAVGPSLRSAEAGPDPIARRSARPSELPRLPLQLTRFFGREQELARLRAMLLGEQRRLVTLTGPGGSGKTRLALEAASLLGEAWRGAVSFVPLADLTDARRIADAVRDALRLPRFPGAEPLEQVTAALARQPSLLLLDNLEHLLPEGASLVRCLLERVPSLTCLVTSRQRLGLTGEREFSVLPLPTPDATSIPDGETLVAALAQCESAQLFVDRAQAVRPDFEVTPANAAAVAAVCRRLEGIPLALELAAAWLGVLTPAQMRDLLEQRCDFLISRQQDTVARHRTLRAAIDWSFQLLAPELQRFFTQLWVFRGGWTLSAAAAICQTPLALEYLEQLRECSLVLAEEQGKEMRFRLLETLREYGRECLTASEQETVRRRHAQFFLALAETAEPELCGAESATWLERLAIEQDNLRAALEWLVESEDAEAGLRLGGVLTFLWTARGHWAEGRERLGRLLALPQAATRTRVRAKALYRAGRLIYEVSGCRDGRPLLEESLAIGRELGEKPLVADALWTLGEWTLRNGDPVAALPLLEESLAIGQEMEDKSHIAAVSHTLAEWHRDQGDLASASALYEASLALFQELGTKWAISWSYKALGDLARQQGNCRAAQACYEKGLGIERKLVDWTAIAGFLEGLAAVASAEGRLRSAARLFGAAGIARKGMGVLQLPGESIEYSRHVAAARAGLGEEAFAAAWAEGRAMPLEQAVGYALMDE